MAPAVPFALLGVVQLTAVAGWVGLGAAGLFPRLRRRTTPLFVLGAAALATADAATAIDFGAATSTWIGWLRVVGLAAFGVAVARGVGQPLVLPAPAVAGLVVPLGAPPAPAYVGGAVGLLAGIAAVARSLRRGADRALGGALGCAFALTGAAAALAAAAGDDHAAAVAELAVRAAATLAVAVALALLARTMLLGKLAGAILAAVVAMAAGAVGVVGSGVADEVQAQQSQRLLQVATAEQRALSQTLAARAALFAQVVARCPGQLANCVSFLRLFSEQPSYFAVIVDRRGAQEVARNDPRPLPDAALVQLAGSPMVRAALRTGSTASTTAGGPVLLPGNPPVLAVVEAVPGRRNGSSDARVRPDFAAVYGVGIVDAYLRSIRDQTGYDLSVVASGRVLASSLPATARAQVQHAAARAAVDHADVNAERVVPPQGSAPTVAFVALDQAGNDDVRLATLAVSQPATEALRAQRSVLQRMFLTALAVLLIVGLLALALARRIADPVRRLTVAAGRVRRGDLDTRTSVRARDEVGSLARAFDAMTASLRDATGGLRRAAEQEAALRARLETVVESMSDGLVVTDADDRVTSVNPAAAALLQVAPGDAVGKRVDDVLRVHDADGRSLLGELRDREIVDARVTVGDGTERPVRLGSAPLADAQGRVFVVADRTREEEVERMKTEFLANVSHELRTPLTPIRGYAEMLARRPDLDRTQVDVFLTEILGSTARMSRVVELLVDVAALEAGRVAPHVARTDLADLLDGRLREWARRYPERAGDLRRDIATPLAAVAVDEHWVVRALDELADNAVKYTEPGTAITVAARATDGRGVCVAIRDEGPGFAADQAAQLVGDFAQADASETRRVGGMGLGLGFVTRVADRFGLPFSVDAAPGRGAEFALLLPVWSDG